jgi:hypothetical protein
LFSWTLEFWLSTWRLKIFINLHALSSSNL